MHSVCWALAAVGSLVGGIVFFDALVSSNGAPQQAAGAALAIGFGVLPYVFARAADELNR
jgi:ABC-type phosphate transport system permease subunit